MRWWIPVMRWRRILHDTGREFCIFFCSWLVHLKKELSGGSSHLYPVFWNNINSGLQSVHGSYEYICDCSS